MNNTFFLLTDQDESDSDDESEKVSPNRFLILIPAEPRDAGIQLIKAERLEYFWRRNQRR